MASTLDPPPRPSTAVAAGDSLPFEVDKYPCLDARRAPQSSEWRANTALLLFRSTRVTDRVSVGGGFGVGNILLKIDQLEPTNSVLAHPPHHTHMCSPPLSYSEANYESLIAEYVRTMHTVSTPGRAGIHASSSRGSMPSYQGGTVASLFYVR